MLEVRRFGAGSAWAVDSLPRRTRGTVEPVYGWLRAQLPTGELTMEAMIDEPAADAGVFVLSGPAR